MIRKLLDLCVCVMAAGLALLFSTACIWCVVEIIKEAVRMCHP